jgi:hypothetical protein
VGKLQIFQHHPSVLAALTFHVTVLVYIVKNTSLLFCALSVQDKIFIKKVTHSMLFVMSR